VIDGTGQTLMPGLVEPSCHLSFPSSVDRIVREFRPPRERHQFHTAHNAKVLLDNGYTSAFSGGATSPAIEVVVRDEVAGSWIHGQGLKAAAFERAIGNLDHLARQPC
jgi:imidazolonepropionase-like amidohydrolase